MRYAIVLVALLCCGAVMAARSCPECGVKLAYETMKFCGECGKPVAGASATIVTSSTLPSASAAAATTTALAVPSSGQPFTNSLGARMVWIAPGTFQMGSPSDEPGRAEAEGPTHEVRLTRGLWMGATEVTQGEWRAVMGANPAKFKGPQFPVETVTWNDCRDFCRRLTEREQSKGTLPPGTVYRLPTEAEWEYACRAGTSTALYTGAIAFEGQNNAPALDPIAWYGGNSGTDDEAGRDSSRWFGKQYPHMKAGTHAVGQKRGNAWGLQDMLGNVWEWCQDGLRPYSTEPQTDPVGPDGGTRVLRGGSWYPPAADCRSAHRLDVAPDRSSYFAGCRVVLGAPVGAGGSGR